MNVYFCDKTDLEGKWFKRWETLCHIKPVNCSNPADIDCQPMPCLVLVHDQKCRELTMSLVEKVVKQSGFVLYVSGGASGCGDSDDPQQPRIHYSKRCVPSNTSLYYLKTRFARLIKALNEDGQNSDKIKLAWSEWESPVMERVLMLMSPLAFCSDNSAIPKAVCERIHKEIDEMRMRVAADELAYDLKTRPHAGVQALHEMLTKTAFSAEVLMGWMQKHPQTLADLSRRCL